MSRQLNPSQVWSQVPVASRTVTVSDKTGFSLTAGSYSVRPSSSQQGTGSISNGATSGSASISTVTLARASYSCGLMYAALSPTVGNSMARTYLSATTTISADRQSTSENLSFGYSVAEFY